MHGNGLASCLGKSLQVGRCSSTGTFYLSSHLQSADWPPEGHLSAAFAHIAAGWSAAAAAAWPAAVANAAVAIAAVAVAAVAVAAVAAAAAAAAGAGRQFASLGAEQALSAAVGAVLSLRWAYCAMWALWAAAWKVLTQPATHMQTFTNMQSKDPASWQLNMQPAPNTDILQRDALQCGHSGPQHRRSRRSLHNQT